MMRSTLVVALAFISYEVAAIELPVVPAAVVEGAGAAVEPKPAVPKKDRRDAPVNQGQALPENSTVPLGTADIKVMPGVNEIVAVAVGHLNRIVTPFETPEIHTTSQAVTRVDGNVVYIGTKTTAPIGLYITDKTAVAEAISLTLVPKRIPPRELRVQVQSQPAGGDLRAKRWEESQPYVETFRNAFRTIALGQTPSGYDFRNEPSRWLPPCIAPAAVGQLEFNFTTGQSLLGHHFEVAIGVVTNKTERPVELDELWCAGDEIAAIAFWPRNFLEPGQTSEVYVAKRRAEPSARPNRASLVTEPSR